MINVLLGKFKEKTHVSTATLLNHQGMIVASENDNEIDQKAYSQGIAQAWKVINKLAKDTKNNFNFYNDIEFLHFDLDSSQISYGVLIKAITKQAILLSIFPNNGNFSFIINEFQNLVQLLTNYFLDSHDHLYM